MTRPFAPLLVVAAALVFGAAVVVGFAAVTGDVVRVLVAVAVAAVGVGVRLLPDVDGTVRDVGAALVAVGAWLLGSIADTDLVRYGVPALVFLVLAAAGSRIWASGAGLLVVLAVSPAPLLALVPAVVVVFAPKRARWGDFAGAVAAAALFGEVSVVAALVAAVLLMTAVVRRDLVTGLLAATVLVTPEPAHAWPLAGIVVLALVAIRFPRFRDLVARGTRPAYAAAGAAVVAASGLVAIALQLRLGWLTLVTALVAAALGHWLPVPSGPALAVVALVSLGVARPFDVAVLDLVTVLVAVPLLLRHPTPPVFAATAYLLLRVVPWVDPVVTLMIVGVVAAVLAFWRTTAAVGQAVGAVVLGAVAFGPVVGLAEAREPVLLALVFVLGVSTGWRSSAPLAVTAALALSVLMTPVDPLVALALLVAAAALVVSAVFAVRRDLMASVR